MNWVVRAQGGFEARLCSVWYLDSYAPETFTFTLNRLNWAVLTDHNRLHE